MCVVLVVRVCSVFFVDCYMLVNNGSLFLSFSVILYCLLSFDDDWQISLFDYLYRSYYKWLVVLYSWLSARNSSKELVLIILVVDDAIFILLSYDVMYSFTFYFLSFLVFSVVFIVSDDSEDWVNAMMLVEVVSFCWGVYPPLCSTS